MIFGNSAPAYWCGGIPARGA